MKRSLLVLLLALTPVGVFAAWEILASFGGQISCVYFLDKQGLPEIGYVILKGGGIYRTTNGGKQWSYLAAVGMSGSFGHDLYFTDAETGYVVGGSPLLVTHDSGKTWSKLYDTYGSGVIVNPVMNRVFVAGRAGGYSVNTTGGGGSGFGSGILRSFASTDVNHMLVTCFENFGAFYYTIDGGASWSASSIGVEAWQPAAFAGSSTYFAASEPFQGTNQIYRSDDWGKDWRLVYKFPESAKLTGTIRASAKTLFVQSDQSFYFSVDSGKTWTPFCGPGGTYDYRFYNVEDTIYAGDAKTGNLWVNRRPLDGPAVAPLSIAPQKLQLGSKGCAPLFGTITINEYTNCVSLPTFFEKVELSGSKQFSFSTDTAKLKYFGLTRVFNFGILYLPNGARYDTAALYIRYRRMGQTFDTTIPIYAELLPTPSFKIEPSEVGLTVRYPCLLRDTLIAFLNDPCDSLTITSVEPVGDNDMIVSYPPLPIVLGPDSMFTIRAGTARAEPGTMYGGIRIRGNAGSSLFDTTITVNIRILEELPLAVSVPRRIDLGRSPVCAVRYDTVKLVNPYCDVVTVTYANAPSGELSAEPLVPLPFTLAPGAELRFACRFAPQTPGLKVAQLIIGLSRGTESHDTTVELRGAGVEVGKLGIDSGLFFDTLTTCEVRSRELAVANESCSPVTITELSLPPAAGSFNYNPKLPIVLQGGERVTFTILFTPQKTERINSSGYVRAQMQSQGEFEAAFPVSCTVIEPSRSMRAEPPSIAASLTVCETIDSFVTIHNDAACDTLSIDSLGLPPGFSTDFAASSVEPGDSVRIPLRFIPLDTGEVNSLLRIYSRTKFGIADTSVKLSFDVSGSEMLFGLEPSVVEFGTIPVCMTRDTSITIYNSGCDTITLSQVASDAASFVLQDIAAPVDLPPGAAYTFRVRAIVDTSNGAAEQSGNIMTQLIGFERQQIQIPLHVSYAYPPKIEVQLTEPEVSAKVAAAVIIGVEATVSSPSFIQADSAALKFTLDYDSDILEYLGTDGNISSVDGKQFDWKLAIASASAPERASVRFQTMLSRNFTTSISLMISSVESSSAPCVPVAASAGATAFTVVTACGDSVLSNFLRGDLPRFSLYPNPASNIIQLTCNKDIDNCVVRIYDQLAIARKSKSVALRADRPVALSLSDLASGIYSVECDYGSGKFVSRIALQR